METNGNGDEGGGVAVEAFCRTEDLAAIMDELKKVPDEKLNGIRRIFEAYNDGTFEAHLAENGMNMQEWAAVGVLPTENTFLLQRIGGMLRDRSVSFLTGIENFLSLLKTTEEAAG